MTEPTLTKADRGLLVLETLTAFKDIALKAANSTDAALLIKQQYTEAVDHLSKSTGVRVNVPGVLNSITTEEEAAILAQTAKRVQQFITARFKTTAWTCNIIPPNTQLRNAVDYQVYDHLATVTQGRQTLFFCQNSKGRYVFSDSKYWTPVAK